MRAFVCIPAAVLLVGTAGCPAREITGLAADASGQIGNVITVTSNRDLDILFVVDNSNSMQEEQENLAQNFPRFIETLDAIDGGRPNVHIGVISSDLGIPPYGAENCVGNGDDGVLQNAPRVPPCDPPTGRFIEDIKLASGSRQTNYSGQLEDVFSCIAQLGVNGCGFEQHLESMKRALDGTNLENAGFVRQGAFLAVIILADEDDCSALDNGVFNSSPALNNIGSALGIFGDFRCAEFGVQCSGVSVLPRTAGSYTGCQPRTDSYLRNPQYYVDFLRSLKSNDPNLVIGAVIGGDPTPYNVVMIDGGPAVVPSCSSAGNGLAYPAVRLTYFLDQLGQANSEFATICQDDLEGALVDVAEKLKERVGQQCLEGNVNTTDIDPAPGRQIACSVTDKLGGVETVVPRCAMVDESTPITTTVPCWWSKVDDVTCPNGTHLFFRVERGGATVPPTLETIVRCES